MPAADTVLEESLKARILAYGAPKTKKTWWALRAAEAGFNVLLLDSDDGYHIVNQIPKEARRRIYVVDATDTTTQSIASIFMTLFCKQKPLYWLEKEKRVALTSGDKARAMFIDFSKFDRNTVVIVDSWSAIVNSLALQFAKENGIDLADASKTEWDGYRWMGQLGNWMMQQLKTFPCHVIVIAHASVYEKKKMEGKQQTTEWTRIQVKSTSGANAMGIPQHFSDIFYFTSLNDKNFRISTSIDKDRDGGSRLIPPGQYDWDKFSFLDYCKLAGIPLPSTDLPLLDFSSNVAETVADLKPATETQPAAQKGTIVAPNAGVKPGLGIAGLIKK